MTRSTILGRALVPAAAIALLGTAPAMAQKGVGAGFVGAPSVVTGGGGAAIGGGGGFHGGGLAGGGFRGGGLGGGGFGRGNALAGGFKGVGADYRGPAGVTTGFGRGGYGFHRGHYGYGYGRGRGGYGYGLATGVGLGLAAGGLYGAYGYPDYGYGYDDGYYGYGYAPAGYAPVETEVTTGGSDEAAIEACARRFKTYDPNTQTYIVRKGVRRSCP